MIIHDPGQDRLINELYVFVAVDPKTNLEGICALGGHPGPQAVTSSKDMMEKIRPIVFEIAKIAGKRIKILRFSKSEVLEEYP